MRRPRVRPASHYQARTDPIRRIADEARAPTTRSIRKALKELRAGVDTKAAAHAASIGDMHGVIAACALDRLPGLLKTALHPVTAAYGHAAKHGAEQVKGTKVRKDAATPFDPAAPDDPYAFEIMTDDFDQKVQDLVEALVAEIDAETRQTIIDAVTRALLNGDPPETVAQMIRSIIGLTEFQQNAVVNYRRLLEEGDASALTRTLRDASYDDLVRMLVDGGSVDPTKIDEMVDAYSERYLDYRADTIARTETVRAANLGLHDAYSQAVADGVFPQAAVRRHWQIAMDEKTCPICEAIPDLNPDGVGVDDPFKTDDGDVDDPPVHVNCRCSVQYRTDLDMLPANQEEDAA